MAGWSGSTRERCLKPVSRCQGRLLPGDKKNHKALVEQKGLRREKRLQLERDGIDD